MDLEAFKAFVQERVIEYDPTIDISDGGAVDTDLVQPILDFIGASPFDSSAFEFVLERLRQFNPDDLVDEGDALTDLAAKPLSHIIDPVVQELTRLKNSLTFRFPDTMERDAAANLGANFFVEMEDGSFTVGTCRIFFSSPLSQSVNSTNLCNTVNGDRFVPAFPQSITQNDMFINRQGSFYYWDVIVRSLEPGALVVERGEMLTIDGLDASVRITNTERFQTGGNQETVAEFAARAREALTERSLVTARGVSARIKELFAQTRAIEVSGYNDIEMGRDVLDYSASGDRARVAGNNPISFPLNLVTGANNNITVETDDGAGGSSGPYTLNIQGTYNTIAELVNTINTAWAAAGGLGTVASSWGVTRLLIHSGSAIPNATQSYLDSVVRLVTPASFSAWASLGYLGEQLNAKQFGTSGIIMSSMPGGILRPNTVNGDFSADERKFHIGGATDVYIRPTESDDGEVSHGDAEDILPAWMGTELVVNPTLINSSRVQDQARTDTGARPGRPNFTQALNHAYTDLKYDSDSLFKSDILNGIVPRAGDIFSIRGSSLAAGTYFVAATPEDDAELNDDELRLSERFDFSSITDLTYTYSPTTRIPLTGVTKRSVKLTTIQGTLLQCFGAIDTVTWVGTGVSFVDTNNFERYGVAVGDQLEIFLQSNGEVSENAGVYTITEINGNQLKLDRRLAAVERVSFNIYETGGDELDLPLVRITSVDILDALGASTGVSVPYALPVLYQSRGITGARVKIEGNNGIINESDKDFFDIPNNYRSFLEMGIEVGDVIQLSHPTSFGTTLAAFRRVIGVAATRLTLDFDLEFSGNVDDVTYSIGKPARGTVRFYFQDPVSFEVQHVPKLTSYSNSADDDRLTSPYPFTLGKRNDDGSITRFFQPRSKGILGSKRLFPALDAAEDPEVSNVSLDDVPSFAQDGEFEWSLSTTETRMSFTGFDPRKYGLRVDKPTTKVQGDALLIHPERMLGQGTNFTYTDNTTAELNYLMRKLNSFCLINRSAPNTLVLPFDFHLNNVTHLRGLTESTATLTAASIEGAFGQLEGSVATIHPLPDGAVSPNTGRFRVREAPAESYNFGHKLVLGNPKEVGTFGLEPTSDLVQECGRTSYDQWVVTVAAGAGNYIVGETVTRDTVTARVGYWDAGNNKIYLYDVSVPNYSTFIPVSTTWTGGTSGTARAQTALDTFIYADPQNGSKDLKFTGSAAAPGFIDADNSGPWVVDRFVTLWGIVGASPTKIQMEDAVSNLGTWKITSVSSDGQTVGLENVTDPSKDLVNTASHEMKWVVSDDTRAMEYFGVYSVFPTPFPVEKALYELSGVVYDSLLELFDPDDLMKDYSDGRAFSGVRVPYQMVRPGRVRVASTEMEDNVEDNLYYMDVDVTSLGPDPEHNLDLDEDLTCICDPDPLRGAYVGRNQEYLGEGYVLEVEDTNYSFSVQENVYLNMYPRILKQGDADLEANKVVLSSKSFGVRYDRSDLVANIDSLLQSDSERTTAASLLARHFTPAFVRLSIEYSGLATVADLVTELTSYIDTLTGSDRIEVSDLEGIIHKQGVDFIDQNFAVAALFHDVTRCIVAERNRNFIGGDEDTTSRRRTTNRVSHFIADKLDFNKI